jgi:hypothetical protein
MKAVMDTATTRADSEVITVREEWSRVVDGVS